MSAGLAKWAAVGLMVAVVAWIVKRPTSGRVAAPLTRQDAGERAGVIVPPDVFTGPDSWDI